MASARTRDDAREVIGSGRRRRRLTNVSAVAALFWFAFAPALHAAVAIQAARVVLARRNVHVCAARADRLAVAIGTPAGDRPVALQTAEVVIRIHQLREHTGRARVAGLAREVRTVTPTFESAADLRRASCQVVRRYGRVLTRNDVELTLAVVGAKTLHGLRVFSDPAPVVVAGAVGQHRNLRGQIRPAWVAPADQLIVRRFRRAC